jgi:hypothetical protein
LGSSEDGLNGLILSWWLPVHSSLKNQVWNQSRGCIKNLKILETEPKVLSNFKKRERNRDRRFY